MRNARFVLTRLLAAGVFTLLPGMTMAQKAEPLYSDVNSANPPKARWHKLTTKAGCFFYYYNGPSRLDDPRHPLADVGWSGECKPGQLATGTGFLMLGFRGAMDERYRGTLQNGFLHGEVRRPTLTSKTLDEMRVMQFNSGCHVSDQHCLKTQPFVKQAVTQGKPVVVLTEGGNPVRVVSGAPASAPSSSPPPAVPSQQQRTATPPAAASSQTPPAADRLDPNRQRKVHNPAADARPCVQAKQTDAKPGGIRPAWNFTNNCNSTIELFWCVVKAGGCSGGGTWTVRAGGTWPVFDEGHLKWGACRGRNGGGMDSGMNGERFTCHLLKW
jgi:hypothetical protein